MGGPAYVRVSCLTLAAALVLAPGPATADQRTAGSLQREAARLAADGEYTGALALIDEGLALEPGRLPLLQLRASTLFEMRDFEGALAAYEAFLAANPKGANRRAALRIVANLEAARTTSLDLTITGATPDHAADVYLDTRSLGTFCTAAPRCKRGLLPGDYKIIVERPGHKKLSERISVTRGQTLALERALVEEPSAVTVAVAGPGATVVLDGKELGAAPQNVTVDAGDHTVEVRAPGHATERRPFAAHRGEPVALDIALTPLVPIAVTPSSAEILLGDKPVAREQDALVLPRGAVAITVRAAGFVPRTVEVPADRPAGYRLDVALDPAPARLTAKGAPRGARIRVDGRDAGTVPLDGPIELSRGDHTIEVSAPGRRSFRTQVTVDSDVPLRLTVTRMPSTRRRWTKVAAAGTSVAVVSWAAFGTLALMRSADFDDRAREPGVTPSDGMLTSLSDSGGTFATLSDVSMALSLAGAGAFTFFYLREGKEPSAGHIGPLLLPDAIGVGGTF